jgi:hypothetical protein
VRDRNHRSVPGAPQVFGLRIEQGNRLGPQFEGTPDDLDAGKTPSEFLYSRLAEPAERSNIIGKYFQLHGGPAILYINKMS